MQEHDEARIAALLQDAATLTQTMRQHQEAVRRMGSRRREVIRTLREADVPYRVIAEACRVTDQALFADLRKHPRPS